MRADKEREAVFEQLYQQLLKDDRLIVSRTLDGYDEIHIFIKDPVPRREELAKELREMVDGMFTVEEVATLRGTIVIGRRVL